MSQTRFDKHPALPRLIERRWPALVSIYTLVCTIGFASWAQMNLPHARLVSWPMALAWEGVIYASWLPFTWIVWRLIVARGLNFRLLIWLYPVLLAGSVLHAVLVLWLDAFFDAAAPSWSGFGARLPIDLLLATAIATFLAAVRGQRLSAEESRRTAALQQALDAARRDTIRNDTAAPERLTVSTGAGSAFVLLSEVEWLSAAGNYVVVNWSGQEGLIRETLTALAQRLDPAIFARTHRSTIVNLARIKSFASMANGAWVVTSESGAELVVSRTYRDTVLKRLTGKIESG